MSTLGLCSLPLPQVVSRHNRSKSDGHAVAASKKDPEQHPLQQSQGLFKLVMTKFSSTPLQESEYSTAEEASFRHHIIDEQQEDPILWKIRNEYPHDAALTQTERQYLASMVSLGDANSIQSSSVGVNTNGVSNGAVSAAAAALTEAARITNTASTDLENAGAASKTHHHCIVDDDEEGVEETVDEESSVVKVNDDVEDGIVDPNDGPNDAKDDDDADDETRSIFDTNTNSATANAAATAVLPELSMMEPPSPMPVPRKTLIRDSMVQQELFRVHETEDVAPSHVLLRMQKQNSILACTSSSNPNNYSTATAFYNDVKDDCDDDDDDDDVLVLTTPGALKDTHPLLAALPISSIPMPVDLRDEMAGLKEIKTDPTASNHSSESSLISNPALPVTAVTGGAVPVMEQDTTTLEVTLEGPCPNGETNEPEPEFLSWNPFEDISSWLDGSQGVEVTGSSSACMGDDSDATTKKTHRRVGSITMVRSSVTACSGATGSGTAGGGNGSNSNNASPATPFRILGTGADDVSCHPHVLSPPLMESLLAFVPEYTMTTTTSTVATTAASSSSSQDETMGHNLSKQQHDQQPDDRLAAQECPASDSHDTNPSLSSTATVPTTPSSSFNFWLKYSLVRDGPSLWTFLRQVRTSTLCFLAIETDEGHVFGAFTSQPWRLAKGWYGSKDTFLWKMRRSRLETAGKSIVQQVCQESEIQVYPYRTGNAAVQYCSKECLMLGQGEIIPSPRLHNPDKPLQRLKAGSKHYGYALYLDKDLTTGTTSSSETFGNPCLIDPEERGARFYVSNIEVWTLTPHDTVAEAEQSELSNLFLDGGRDNAHRLNFMNILVGGPI